MITKMTVLFQKIKIWSNANSGTIGLFSFILALLIWASPTVMKALNHLVKVSPALMNWIEINQNNLMSWGLVLALLTSLARVNVLNIHVKSLAEKVSILETRPEILLDAYTASNLSNWSYRGKWAMDDSSLQVTDSLEGGICKIGATWENYEFDFDFKIINECAAWIIRASAIEHYFMIQCNKKQIRPHTRSLFLTPERNPVYGFQVIAEVDHGLNLEGWNHAKTIVKGFSVKVLINDELKWSHPDVLSSFKVGTIGFRCYNTEQSLFKNIEVKKG